MKKEMIDIDTEKDVVQVIKLLTTLDEDLPLKTEIDNPLLMTIIDVQVDNLKDKLPASYQTANAFRTWLRVNNVSNKRKGRLEVIEALRTLREYAQTRLNKVMGNRNSE